MSFAVKKGINIEELEMVHVNLLILFAAFSHYAYVDDLPVVITSIMEDVAGRKTETHREGRAIDISMKGWSRGQIYDVIKEFNAKYSDIAAISKSDGVPRAIVGHDIGLGPHFHLQVRP